MMKSPKLIVIQGPTASGKTKLAVELAKKLETVVISADSRQFYKEISIGTAKPTLEEMQGVPHFFINSHQLSDEVSAARFTSEALKLIQTDLSELEFVIVVGGSGLFIQALCEGLDAIPHDQNLRMELTDIFEKNGLNHFLEELKLKDKSFYDKVDKENPYRVLRAIEAMRISGKTMTELRSGESVSHFDEVHYYTIEVPREELYARINERVDHMMALGLEKEARDVFHLKHLKSLQTVGYREFFDYFDGKITFDKTIELIKQHSRNYAKRQITWFKSHHPGIILNGDLETNLKTILSNSR